MIINDSNPPKPKRRWYQFSMGTLLVMVIVLAVPLGWVGWELEQARKEQKVAAWANELPKVGIVAQPEFLFFFEKKSWWEESTDEWLGERVHVINLNYKQVSDLSRLAELRSVKMITLVNTQVSDLSPLTGLKNLETLDLGNTLVSDLSPLTGLKNLNTLRLSDTPVSDEQVQHLRQALPNCKIIR